MKELDITGLCDLNPTNIGFMFNFDAELEAIYSKAGTDWSNISTGSNVFHNCQKLKGGAGTVFNSSEAKGKRAVIDGLNGKAGYFIAKS